jgi:hypothetical protein
MDRVVSLDELLDEPIVRLLMRRDGVRAHEVRALVEAVCGRIATNRRDQKKALEYA